MKKTKTLSKLKAELQLIFNQFIRLRDNGQPCISCNQFKEAKQAGHYYPVKGYDALRFNEFNVNGECPGCNCFDGGHLINYGDNLIKKIGKENFAQLKKDAKAYKMNGYKWSKSELLEKIGYYKEKIKELN
ncbi:MAG: recombination protein NinG [Spirochaetota bacterium]|nr:recombination protein NinG [Spirochaetota bacterium]